jgi:hypothetical protein
MDGLLELALGECHGCPSKLKDRRERLNRQHGALGCIDRHDHDPTVTLRLSGLAVLIRSDLNHYDGPPAQKGLSPLAEPLHRPVPGANHLPQRFRRGSPGWHQGMKTILEMAAIDGLDGDDELASFCHLP